MVDEKKVIECTCGKVIEGESDDALVAIAQAHATQVHDMELTREQALEMARPA